MASAELERVKQLALEEKEARARELRDKRMHAQARAEMNRLARERETARLDRAAAIAGDLAAEEEEELRAAVEEQLRRRAEVEEETRRVRQKVELYEEAFRRIQEATGVRDEKEVTTKILGQKEQQSKLRQLTRDNQRKIEELKEEALMLKQHLDAVKFGSGGAGGSVAAGAAGASAVS